MHDFSFETPAPHKAMIRWLGALHISPAWSLEIISQISQPGNSVFLLKKKPSQQYF
jgi:hypothetical protein